MKRIPLETTWRVVGFLDAVSTILKIALARFLNNATTILKFRLALRQNLNLLDPVFQGDIGFLSLVVKSLPLGSFIGHSLKILFFLQLGHHIFQLIDVNLVLLFELLLLALKFSLLLILNSLVFVFDD